MVKKYHFKSKSAYGRWVAYGHIHDVMKGCGKAKIYIKGKPHHVIHVRKCKR